MPIHLLGIRLAHLFCECRKKLHFLFITMVCMIYSSSFASSFILQRAANGHTTHSLFTRSNKPHRIGALALFCVWWSLMCIKLRRGCNVHLSAVLTKDIVWRHICLAEPLIRFVRSNRFYELRYGGRFFPYFLLHTTGETLILSKCFYMLSLAAVSLEWAMLWLICGRLK